jgi:hypothetical protein
VRTDFFAPSFLCRTIIVVMVPISAGHPVRGPKWFLELDARYYYNQRRVVGGVVDYIKLGNKS